MYNFVFVQAIVDAAKLGIPTVGIVDSDCNPNIISYPIPGNDDTLDSMQLYLHLFKQAILIGKKKRTEEFNKQIFMMDDFMNHKSSHAETFLVFQLLSSSQSDSINAPLTKSKS